MDTKPGPMTDAELRDAVTGGVSRSMLVDTLCEEYAKAKATEETL